MTRIGPSAKPALPPSEKKLMPWPRRSPLTWLAKRAPSGWNAATPSPLIATAAAVAG